MSYSTILNNFAESLTDNGPDTGTSYQQNVATN